MRVTCVRTMFYRDCSWDQWQPIRVEIGHENKCSNNATPNLISYVNPVLTKDIRHRMDMIYSNLNIQHVSTIS
jgi:hypothetical protein